MYIGTFMFWCITAYAILSVFLYICKAIVNKLGKTLPHLWIIAEYALNREEYKEWRKNNKVLTLADEQNIPKYPDPKPEPPPKQFTCYEIHRPNIPVNGCTKQCEECYAKSIKFDELKAEMRNAGNLYI